MNNIPIIYPGESIKLRPVIKVRKPNPDRRYWQIWKPLSVWCEVTAEDVQRLLHSIEKEPK